MLTEPVVAKDEKNQEENQPLSSGNRTCRASVQSWYTITKSIAEVSRDFWRSSGLTPLLKRGVLELFVQDHVQLGLNISKDRDCNLSGKPVPAFEHLHCENCFSYFKHGFPYFKFVSLAFSPVNGHWWEESGSLDLIPSHQVFIHTEKIHWSLLLSRLNSHSSPNLPLCEWCPK